MSNALSTSEIFLKVAFSPISRPITLSLSPYRSILCEFSSRVTHRSPSHRWELPTTHHGERANFTTTARRIWKPNPGESSNPPIPIANSDRSITRPGLSGQLLVESGTELQSFNASRARLALCCGSSWWWCCAVAPCVCFQAHAAKGTSRRKNRWWRFSGSNPFLRDFPTGVLGPLRDKTGSLFLLSECFWCLSLCSASITVILRD